MELGEARVYDWTADCGEGSRLDAVQGIPGSESSHVSGLSNALQHYSTTRQARLLGTRRALFATGRPVYISLAASVG